DAVAVQADGRIVLAGGVATGAAPTSRVTPGGVITGFRPLTAPAAVRLLPNGRLDPSFGDGGRVRVPPTEGTGVGTGFRAAHVLPDGRIVLAGKVVFDAGDNSFPGEAVRLTADGKPDPTYGTNGVVFTPFGSVYQAEILPDGRTLFSGDYVTRLTADGKLDPGFGTDGSIATGTLALGYGSTHIRGGLAALPDGRVLLGGFASTLPSTGAAVLIRLLGDGPFGAITPAAGTVQVGGTPDGTTRVLQPTAGKYESAGVIMYFPGFHGAVRTATADLTGDGVSDYTGGAGPGGGPRVVLLDGRTGATLADFFAFETSFTGGVFVAAADLDGDGKAEVVVTPDRGGGPVVAVFDGTGAERGRFLGIDDPAFRGGARPALGDVNGDGTPDLIVSAGIGGGPRVALFDGKSVVGGASPVKLLPDFFAFEATLRNGAFVAAGDVTGDGAAEMAFGGGPGGAPRVRLFDGAGLLAAGPFTNLDEIPTAQRANFFAGDSARRGGVRVALRDADGDGKADLVTGSGEGEPSRVRVYRSATLLANPTPAADQELDPFGAVPADGVFVG
ncbi:MAG TPA: FG-GAP-like repeat-containing protein, partial [Fimbriiglobus sp.]|nr:FG-GAP-like repeat-containing protein [Fimbriiglobus sp.]